MRLAVSIFVTLMLLQSSTPASAEFARPTLDTESLAVQSRLIVMGTIVDQRMERVRFMGHEGDVPIWQVRVDDVIAGPFLRIEPCDGAEPKTWAELPMKVRKDEKIDVTGLGVYEITEDLLGGQPKRRLQAKDRVVLFLVHKTDRFHSPSVWGETSAPWVVSANRLRYISGAHAYAFVQSWRGRVMDSHTITVTRQHFPEAELLPTATFLRRIRDAISEKDRLRALIDDAKREHIDQLMEICGQRAVAAPGEVTAGAHWSEYASLRIDELADAETIVGFFKAPWDMKATGYWPSTYSLARRLDVRERLLVMLENDELLPGRRGAALDVFDDGRNYQTLLEDAAREKSALPHGGQLATRLAAIAIKTADGELMRETFRCVEDCMMFGGMPSPPGLDQDLKAAAELIIDAWPTLSPYTKFEAAVTLWKIAPLERDRITPSPGAFVTMIELNSNERRLAKPGQLRVDYRYDNLLPKTATPATLVIMFRSEDGRMFEQPFDADGSDNRPNDVGGNMGNRPGVVVDVPDALPAGTYDVFLQSRSDGKALGDGIGFTWEYAR